MVLHFQVTDGTVLKITKVGIWVLWQHTLPSDQSLDIFTHILKITWLTGTRVLFHLRSLGGWIHKATTSWICNSGSLFQYQPGDLLSWVDALFLLRLAHKLRPKPLQWPPLTHNNTPCCEVHSSHQAANSRDASLLNMARRYATWWMHWSSTTVCAAL